MGPCKQKDRKRESYAGRGKDQGLEPTILCCDSFVKARADARHERGRYGGVRSGAKADVDGGEEGLFLFKCGAAGGAGIELRAQMPLWLGTAGRGFDQRVFTVFAWHRNFSANCLRA